MALVAGIIGNSVSAQDSVLTLDLTADSKYIFRGLELAEASLFPSLQYSFDDMYVGIWAAVPMQNTDAFSDEIDLYAGKSWALDEKTSVDMGGTFYTYPNADDTFEAYFGISREMEGDYSLSAYLYRDIDLNTWSTEFTFGYSMPISDKASFDIAFYVGGVFPDDATDYGYTGVDAVIPFKINDTTNFTIGAHWSDHNFKRIAEKGHFHASAGFTFAL